MAALKKIGESGLPCPQASNSRAIYLELCCCLFWGHCITLHFDAAARDARQSAYRNDINAKQNEHGLLHCMTCELKSPE